MGNDYLTESEARNLVEQYMKNGEKEYATQEIVDLAVPELRGFTVRPGKVSDSIFGGAGSYYDKASGETIEFENPTLLSIDGIPLRIMVRTQKISTHDINRGEIPFKDQILAMNHNFMRRLVSHLIGTSQYDVPGLADNAVVIAAENLQQIGFENVLRAYMAKTDTATSLYVHYMRGERNFCGHSLPSGLFANGPLPYVMDTPSTKSDVHDESVSPQELYSRKICTPEQYMNIRNNSLAAFGAVSGFLRSKNLIAADTKTEHGINRKGEIVSQDEIWTMDSSRFWLLDDYNQQLHIKERIGEQINPTSYSKEFARGFSKGENGYTEQQIMDISVRYVMGIQHLLGKRFEPDMRPRYQRVIDGLQTIVKELVM